MLANRIEQQHLSNGNWFLVACDGDVVLRIAGSMRIGEDESGELVLWPSLLEELIEITSNGQELEFRMLVSSMSLAIDSHLDQIATIRPHSSVVLELPHCTLPLTRSLLALGHDPEAIHVRIVPRPEISLHSEVASASYRKDPAQQEHAEHLVTRKILVEPTETTTAFVSDTPLVKPPSEPRKKSQIGNPPARVEISGSSAPIPIRAPASRSTLPARKRRNPHAALVILACLLALLAVPNGGNDLSLQPDAVFEDLSATTGSQPGFAAPGAAPPAAIQRPEKINPQLYASVAALIQSFDTPDDATIDFALQAVELILQEDPDHAGAVDLQEYLLDLPPAIVDLPSAAELSGSSPISPIRTPSGPF